MTGRGVDNFFKVGGGGGGGGGGWAKMAHIIVYSQPAPTLEKVRGGGGGGFSEWMRNHTALSGRGFFTAYQLRGLGVGVGGGGGGGGG